MKRGIGIIHYNRQDKLQEILEAVIKTAPEDCRIVLADDQSVEFDTSLLPDEVVLIRGKNLGVSYNKNRALWGLQDCSYIALLEDDLKPIEEGWFETYEEAAKRTGTHHFCRVQDKVVRETHPTFTAHLGSLGYTPVFGSSPRGDFTFLTGRVVRTVGGFHPDFIGIGYAHGEWSERVAKAGLIPHPLKWYDIKEGRDRLVQLGDTEGGRWEQPRAAIRTQLRRNEKIRSHLETIDYIYHPITLK